MCAEMNEDSAQIPNIHCIIRVLPELCHSATWFRRYIASATCMCLGKQIKIWEECGNTLVKLWYLVTVAGRNKTTRMKDEERHASHDWLARHTPLKAIRKATSQPFSPSVATTGQVSHRQTVAIAHACHKRRVAPSICTCAAHAARSTSQSAEILP